MLGRRIRDSAAFAAVLLLLGTLPGSHALSATPGIAVAGVTTARSLNAKSLALPRPNNTAAGAFLVAALSVRVPSAGMIVPPAGWTLVRSTSNDGAGTALSQVVYTHVATASEPSSYSWKFGSSTTCIGTVLTLTGVDGTQPVDDSSGLLSSNTNAMRAPSVTASQSADALIALFGTSGTGSSSPPAGMVELFDQNNAQGGPANRVSLEGAFLDQVGTGVTGDAVALSSTVNSSNIGQLIAFRAAASQSPPPTPDFSISLANSSSSVQQESSATSTVQVSALNGFTGAVSFSVAGLPSGVASAFSPTAVTTSGASTLTLTADASAPTGTYALTLTGTSGSEIHSAPLTLTVMAPPDFALSLSPTAVTMQEGGTASSTVQVRGTNGFTGNVALSATGLPTGLSANFSPTSVAADGSSTLTLNAAANVPAGTYPVSVTGTSGYSLARTSLLSATVTNANVGYALPAALPASTGTDFYVSTSGSDTNPGTLAAPWRTIQKALNTLQPGQRALVLAGTYTENLVFSRAGTATAPITVEANPGDTVILHAASAADGVNWYPVQITGSYFRVHGFVIENGLGNSDANVYFWGGANHVELSGNEIRNGQDGGVFTDNSTSYIYLLGNRIHDNGLNHQPGQHQSHGIYLEGSHDLLANNVIYNHAYGFGIHIYPANHDTIVTDNTVAASAFSPIVVGGSGGVYNITIRDNVLYGGNYGQNGSDYGVAHDSCPTGPVSVDHNVIYAYNVTPVDGGCSSIDTSGGNTVANPLFVDYTNRDLHLQSASPGIDHAVSSWSETHDFAGVSRPQGLAPDLGAFER